MDLFDTHCHYNDESFDEDRDEIIKKTFDAGITKIACVGTTLEDSKKAIEIASKYNFMFATVGIHPTEVTIERLKELGKIKKMARNSKVKAIGEIGLDYHYTSENKELQKEFFIKQIEIANELNLPIAIHSRDAFIDTIDILKEHKCENTGIFHCCQLNQELIKSGLKLGYYISFAGSITRKNAHPEDCIKLIPLDRILIETDSPYQTPEIYKGKRNDSRNVIEIAKKIAEIKNVSLEEIAKITYDNALKVYKLVL